MIRLSAESLRTFRWIVYIVGLLSFLYPVFRRNLKDRVLICEGLGVGVFVVGIVLWKIFGLPDWFIGLAGTTAVVFGALALYFALDNWVRRRRESSEKR